MLQTPGMLQAGDATLAMPPMWDALDFALDTLFDGFLPGPL